MRVRLTLSFVALLGSFGWILSRSISHTELLQKVYDHEGQQHHIRMALWVFMGILFPAVAVGAWILVGRTLRPLRALSRQASESSTQDLSVRLVSPSSDLEMTELVETINQLLGNVEATATAKARFYLAASHELRTPLQALSGHIETALSQDRPAAEYRSALAEAQRQADRLNTLTHDILLLHHLQSQKLAADESADVAASVKVAITELQPLLEARQLNLSCEIPAELIVSGRQSFSEFAVRNLIENAIRYATANGNVSIFLDASKLVVYNDCILGSDVDMESFFEPFELSDLARNNPGSGNGLGLAICRAATLANGWKANLSRNATGVVATITFGSGI
ncbi:MAG: HAMP domain-containing protein [Armatimonadetes bacterium]|nr:HAMP domain-containing protein [Armatimonadota bacterium]